MRRASPVSLVLGSILVFTPVLVFAASSVASEEEQPSAEESMPAPNSLLLPGLDGLGGGGGGGMFPGPLYPGQMVGVTVDASVTREITPDYISISAYCDTGKVKSRDEGKAMLQPIYEDLRRAVGKDGRIHRTGSISIFPYFDSYGQDKGDSYQANMSVLIRVLKVSSAQRISDAVEAKGCGATWDVRLLDAQQHELALLSELTNRLNQRKKIFEKLLNKRLTKITAVSLYTTADGYSTYDPETNKVDAVTTLSITFDLGGRTILTPPPLPAFPRG